jgi:hypothetical protein
VPCAARRGDAWRGFSIYERDELFAFCERGGLSSFTRAANLQAREPASFCAFASAARPLENPWIARVRRLLTTPSGSATDAGGGAKSENSRSTHEKRLAPHERGPRRRGEVASSNAPFASARTRPTRHVRCESDGRLAVSAREACSAIQKSGEKPWKQIVMRARASACVFFSINSGRSG